MAILKDFILKAGLVANTSITVAGVNVLANDYATLLTAQSNDYNTYTTLVGFIDAVSDNVGAGSDGYNANDYNTYTTLQGEFAANDYATYTALQGAFAANDYATLLAARANDYNSYTALSGAFAANDYVTYTTLQGEFAANDYATYTTLQSEFAANDYATLLAARANDYSTYTTLQGEFAANDYATYTTLQGEFAANDYNTLTTLQSEFAANDYATLLAARSNDYSTLTTLRSEFAANDYNGYATLVGFINAVQDNVTSGGDASNTWVNANDYTTYSTLVNEYQGNDYATYTTLQSEIAANDYNTYSAVIAFANIKANSSVSLTAGDGLSGGGDLSTDRSFAVDASVVRTTGNQTLNNTYTFSDNVVIEGGLFVNGNVTVVATTNMVVEDRFIELGSNTTGLPTADAGIYFNRGDSGNSAVYYDESAGYFAVAHSNDPTTNVVVSPSSYANLRVQHLTVDSDALVTNLNADFLDSFSGSYYLDFLNFTNTNAITLDYITANGASTTNSIEVGGLNVDTGTLYVDSTNNYVGIQTVTPGAALQVKEAGIHTATLTTTATTADQVVDSWAAATFRTAKYVVQIHDTGSNEYHASEILLIHDGLDVYLTEYAIVFTDASLASFSADISGGNVRLLVTPTNADNDITVVRTTLIV
jgi:predicted lipid-binding transport protein (Tim44 family)